MWQDTSTTLGDPDLSCESRIYAGSEKNIAEKRKQLRTSFQAK